MSLPASTIAQSTEPLLLHNARIYTVNEQQPWADAVWISGEGKILQVGSFDDLNGEAGEAVKRIDLGGRMVLPGFQDAHLHAVEAGINDRHCLFEPDESLSAIALTLEDCAETLPAKGWLVGSGINMERLLEKTADPIALLDEVVPDRPVLILDDLGHGAWANSIAMVAVGYDQLEADPPGGILLRDAVSGALNGVVLENAQQPLRNAAYAPTKENLEIAYQSLLQAQERLSANGITSVSDAGGFWLQEHPQAWFRLAREGRLNVRASNALYLYPDLPLQSQIEELVRRKKSSSDGFVRFDQIKIYMDGILSQGTGALYQPYQADVGIGAGDGRGFLYFDVEALMDAAKRLDAAGFQLHFHATGARGVGLALDVIEAIGDIASGPHRITHLYVVAKKDVSRFKALGVFADFQLSPSSVSGENSELMKALLWQRAKRLMPIASLLNSGSDVVLSSDWDADALSPLLKLETVLTRPHGERVPDLATAIYLMTLAPARLLRHADITGSIEPGKLADLVVLDHNLFDMSPSRLREANVVATLLEGETVFDRDGLFE